MITLVIAILCLFSAIVWWFTRKNYGDLHKIPGPGRNFWGFLFKEKTNPARHHLNNAELKEKYGPIVKTTNAGRTILVLSDYNIIYQVLVLSGKQFGGRRPTYFRDEGMKNTGILFNGEPDDTWRLLRKISQKHLRQFGDGLSKLESVITEVADDMFEEFQKNAGKPFDPARAIFDTALNSIAFLITGERSRSGDLLVEKMREYEALFLAVQPVFSPKYFQMLTYMPWLKHLGFDRWKPFNRFCQLQSEIWDMVKSQNENNPDAKSICKAFSEHISSGADLKECDAQMASLTLLFAGVTTTSTTFVSAVNILAHNKHIQDILYRESEKILDQTGHAPTLADRPNMPHTRAVLHEILRYTSPVPHGVTHMTLQDAELQGFKIPAGTDFSTNLWTLHHDESFWDDPYEFRHERFLDAHGDVVPADHPNRTHLMPFGAGTRVCVGESLALARLFLWLSTLVTRFEIKPGPGNLKEAADARNYIYAGVMKPKPYKVVFCERNENL